MGEAIMSSSISSPSTEKPAEPDAELSSAVRRGQRREIPRFRSFGGGESGVAAEVVGSGGGRGFDLPSRAAVASGEAQDFPLDCSVAGDSSRGVSKLPWGMKKGKGMGPLREAMWRFR